MLPVLLWTILLNANNVLLRVLLVAHSKRIPVTLVEPVYVYDHGKKTYEPTALREPQYSPTGCSCTGALYEVEYTVYVSAGAESNRFEIDSATAKIAISSTVSGCGTALVPQKYSVRFLSTKEDPVGRSGNPGYLSGLPVLVGYDGEVTG